MARHPFAVTDAVREKVRYLAGVGVRQDDIAKIIGCSPKTLRKRCRDELDRGVAEANATMFGYLFAAAKGGNIAAIIFWLKTRANLRETPDNPVPSADDESEAQGVLVLPDNCRDPGLTQVLRTPKKSISPETTATVPEAQDLIRSDQRRRKTPGPLPMVVPSGCPATTDRRL